MLTDSRLTIVFETGTDDEGKPILKTKSFNNVKTEATNEELTAVANALTPLQGWILQRVDRANVHSLV
ncbi:DUF1659 domain-containing protein [Bacillus solitudinis]|uniref:DUF1659 domain-containing protein n=1 Tax=Bacillus solitudinis TaxID=2014074 RepID=UPI000C249018|nr:DUF1659 domain-containing protein [Bacillus solitudinis]